MQKAKTRINLFSKKEFNINLKKSYFIGDSANDYFASIKAKVKPIILNKNFKDDKSCIYKHSIEQAINYILDK